MKANRKQNGVELAASKMGVSKTRSPGRGRGLLFVFFFCFFLPFFLLFLFFFCCLFYFMIIMAIINGSGQIVNYAPSIMGWFSIIFTAKMVT